MAQARDALLRSREMFYETVHLHEDVIFCGDDRPSDWQKYIHVFGGVTNIAFNGRVMHEVASPGSSAGRTFADDVRETTPLVRDRAHALPGVHSSDQAETGPDIAHASKLDVDCGYEKLRKAISEGISDNGQEVLAEAKQQRPELFQTPEDEAYAHGVIAAHGRIAATAGYFTTGRDVSNAATEQGAQTMLVKGKHLAHEGIINLSPNTSINTTSAAAANLPVYDHSSWATAEIFAALREQYPYNDRQQAIADLIDTVGTMRALSVTVIATHRPESQLPMTAAA